jgi:transmembrane sensor
MNTQICEEAGEWVVRHRADNLNAADRRRFDAWLRQSPLHVRAYLEMSSIWEGVPNLDPAWNVSADELMARARADSNVLPLGEPASREASSASQPAKPGVARSRAFPGLFFSLAATLLVAVGIAGWLYLQRGVYSTGFGEQRTIVLADGSVIELNARSRIKVHYSDRERGIDLLEGQALFRVSKNPARPFVVESNGTQVRAVGTQFDVYRKNAGTVVTVVEGRVAVLASTRHPTMTDAPDPVAGKTVEPAHTVSSANEDSASASRESAQASNAREVQAHKIVPRADEVLLDAGEQLLVAEAAPAAPQPANVEAVIAWTQQRLVFDFTPLTEVAEEFNRYNRRRLVIDDPGLQGFHVSGDFSSTDPALLLRFLRDQPGISVDETTTEIRISRRETGTG